MPLRREKESQLTVLKKCDARTGASVVVVIMAGLGPLVSDEEATQAT